CFFLLMIQIIPITNNNFLDISHVQFDNMTINGNSKGAPCVFPFFYNGAYYNNCACFGHPNRWCSTTDNYTRDGLWGECLNYAPCVFPFFYNGSYHDDCVSFDRPNPWCSTTDNYTRDGQWGECLNYGTLV
uniref:Fibronectin type-II domain-containing protein n=1 Tax=Pygocentrus nattereri TaxID=42514 RepID=A0A3B4D4Y9_PYGNA